MAEALQSVRGLMPGKDKVEGVTARAAQRIPRRVARQRSLRQTRASGLAAGWPGTGPQRVLKANAAKTKSRMPAVNFESRAPERLKANQRVFFLLGSCHSSANLHTVSKENSVTARSVWTRGPKARKAGVLT